MRTARIVTAAAMSLAVLVPPAGATHGGIHPTFRTERTYFHCTGATKVYNVNYFILGQPYKTGWNAAPPAQSFQQGAGCGGYEYGGFTNEAYDVAFEGTFTGNVRDMTIEIHQLLLGNARQGTTETLRLNTWIDNKPLFPPGTQPSNGRTVTVTPERSSTGASEKYVFSIANVGYATEVKDENGKVVDVLKGGAALEDGDGAREHTFLLFLGVHGNTTAAEARGKLGIWVWDATEIPSGITFNPATLAPARMNADLPVYP